MEDKKSNKENPFDHRLIRPLLPEYLADISELEAKKAELDATIKTAKATGTTRRMTRSSSPRPAFQKHS